MDYWSTVMSYYTYPARDLTVCDPVVAEMHAKALPLTGNERVKAYQAAVAKRCRHCARPAVIIEAF
jgi:hypothetical protein